MVVDTVGMGLRLGSVVINCSDLDRMVAFWAAALDLTAGPIVDGGTFPGAARPTGQRVAAGGADPA
jgi:hypothetical protein